jgi:hypothetical protein
VFKLQSGSTYQRLICPFAETSYREGLLETLGNNCKKIDVGHPSFYNSLRSQDKILLLDLMKTPINGGVDGDCNMLLCKCGTSIQAGRSRVRLPMVSEFFIEIILAAVV